MKWFLHSRLRLTIVNTLLILLSCQSLAQDIHFTQFFNTPILMTPANTGFMNGDYRLAINYRYQWPWAVQGVFANYHTQAAYADFRIAGKNWKRDWFGTGLSFLHDHAGDGALSYLRGGISVAYHKGFDDDGRFVLSPGFGVAYINRSADFEKYYFNNQWQEEVGFNTALNSGEPQNLQSFHMVDLSAGLQFSMFLLERWRTSLGYHLLHINRPKHSFYNQKSRLAMRQLVSLHSTVSLTQTFGFGISAYYTYQNKAQEIALSGQLIYTAPKKRNGAGFAFAIGGIYRYNDAVAPYVALEFYRVKLGASYDLNLSQLTEASRNDGGLELSLSYVGNWGRGGKGKLACPEMK